MAKDDVWDLEPSRMVSCRRSASSPLGEPPVPQSSSSPRPEAKLNGLQWLRAFASISVVAFHASLRVGAPFFWAQAGVDLFFVISGYIMWTITAEETSAGEFAVKRILRIVPMYWVATALAVVLDLANPTKHVALGNAQIIKSLFFIPYVNGFNHKMYPVLIQGWTLNYEMFFYVAMATALLLRRDLRLAAIFLFLAGFPIAGALVQARGMTLAFYANPIILEFLAGIVIAILSRRLERRPNLSWLLLGFLALVFATSFLIRTPHSRVLAYGLPAALIVAVVVWLEKGRFSFNNRILVFLGDASYSIYLMHQFGMSIAQRLFAKLPGAPELLLLTLVGVLTGCASYQFLERPILSSTRSLRGRLASVRARTGAARPMGAVGL